MKNYWLLWLFLTFLILPTLCEIQFSTLKFSHRKHINILLAKMVNNSKPHQANIYTCNGTKQNNKVQLNNNQIDVMNSKDKKVISILGVISNVILLTEEQNIEEKYRQILFELFILQITFQEPKPYNYIIFGTVATKQFQSVLKELQIYSWQKNFLDADIIYLHPKQKQARESLLWTCIINLSTDSTKN